MAVGRQNVALQADMSSAYTRAIMNHLAAIEALVTFSVPVSEAKVCLEKYQWNTNTELVVLTQGHLRNALSLFKSGSLSASEVQDWAKAVEGRQDIGVSSSRCRKLLHELLLEQLSPERADYWLSLLP